jgi:uroporphyrinogen decarboxylase
MNAYKKTGAGGVMVAEPLAGLLSPALMEEFAAPYMKRIVDAVQTDDFLVVYHNCGDAILNLTDGIVSCGAAAYHFGDAINLVDIIEKMPSDKPVCGNISPVAQFLNGTPESMRTAVLDLRRACESYPNFVLSSGCDIPPAAKWENIDAFFAAAKEQI